MPGKGGVVSSRSRLCVATIRLTHRDDKDEMRRQDHCSRDHGLPGAAVEHSFSRVSINRKSLFGVTAANAMCGDVQCDGDDLRTTASKRGRWNTKQKHVPQPATTRLGKMTRLFGLAITTAMLFSCANGAPAAHIVWDGSHDNTALKSDFSSVNAGKGGLTARQSSAPEARKVWFG